MIQLSLDWREVLWWMQGGMAGSHLRWGVYEDMVNKVWPQCSEQERRNLWLVMRRDLGTYWRPCGWQGMDFDKQGEGKWSADILDETPWMYFRQVLARFNPENQYAVTMRVRNMQEWESTLRSTPDVIIIDRPNLSHFKHDDDWQSDTATFKVRAYLWEGEYRIDWSRRCAEDAIVKIENLDIPDMGEM